MRFCALRSSELRFAALVSCGRQFSDLWFAALLVYPLRSSELRFCAPAPCGLRPFDLWFGGLRFFWSRYSGGSLFCGLWFYALPSSGLRFFARAPCEPCFSALLWCALLSCAVFPADGLSAW